ncbi:hypothetical protein D3870_00310 [Noviherbaspirillum cavernae]|uniref:Uncharacterized protein n=1 Tax=Noviherbaspirillum cavernae TaxID=2320862 RepID=A0A418WWP8_9BURK|nr:hypothetical protein D3870_00310 [Noviherbaspirillum cavernae]
MFIVQSDSRLGHLYWDWEPSLSFNFFPVFPMPFIFAPWSFGRLELAYSHIFFVFPRTTQLQREPR